MKNRLTNKINEPENTEHVNFILTPLILSKMSDGKTMDSKIKEQAKLFLTELIFILSLFLVNISPNYAQGNKSNMNSLQEEILEVQLNNSTRLDVTLLIKKYIPIGMDELKARQVLVAADFRIYEIKNQQQTLYQAVWKYKKGFLSQYEARITFRLGDSKVTSISGEIIYLSV